MQTAGRQHFSAPCCFVLYILPYIYLAAGNPRKDLPPAAIAVPSSAQWYGYDGNWSATTLQLGLSSIPVDVFVSTVGREIWAVGPGGCSNSSASSCELKRGGVFDPILSRTWEESGDYRLRLDPHVRINLRDNGEFGYDRVTINSSLTINKQIIAVINTTHYLLGFLGLGVKPPNIPNNTKQTFISSLVENGFYIPSHSYGYTAGKHYESVPASLTLGGYDAKRHQPHNVSFNLDTNQNPTVTLSKITISANPVSSSNTSASWSSSPTTLFDSSSASSYTIDSSTPYLWLPETVCAQFEKALGLVWDNRIQLYTFGSSSTQHKSLINRNLTFDFQLADASGSPGSVSISLPYKAFDLQLTYYSPSQDPLPSSPSMHYFPLRRAMNSSQYTIGRAFLQESYLIVDYERNNFSIYQAPIGLDAVTTTSLVDIIKPTETPQPTNLSQPSSVSSPTQSAIPTNATTAGTDRSSGVNRAEIAGTIVGVCTLIAGGAFLVFFCLHRSRQKASKRNQESPPNELPGSESPAPESPIDRETNEVMSNPLSEMSEGGSAPSTYGAAVYERRPQNSRFPRGHDPHNPIELQSPGCAMELFAPNAELPLRTDSMAKYGSNDSTAPPTTASLPPYSPRHLRNSNVASPTSDQSSRTRKHEMTKKDNFNSIVSSQSRDDKRPKKDTSSPLKCSLLTTDLSNKPLPLPPGRGSHVDAAVGKGSGLSAKNERRRARPNYELFSSYEAAGIPRVLEERERMPQWRV